jgi:hypothetical protein
MSETDERLVLCAVASRVASTTLNRPSRIEGH